MDTELQAWLESHGQTFTPDLSESHAFKSYKNENGKGWYIYKRYNDAIVFTFGDWKTGDKYTFKSTADLDPSDPEYIALQEKAEALREEKARDARLHALSELNKSGQNMMTPYLEKKGFTDTHPTLHQILNHFGEMDLLVPMQDASGEIWNLQRIEPEGTKSFLEGGRTKGLYHLLRPVPESGVIYLVEGVSTGLSVLSLVEEGACVVVAFSATNLIHVAKLLREKHPTHKIIVCADNDHLKDLNFGLKAACDACLAVGAEIIYPPFTVKQPGTDWNDLILDLGFDNAKKEFTRQLDTPNSITGLVETNYGKEIKPKKKRTKKTNSKSQTEFVEHTTEEQIPSSAETTSDLQQSRPSGEPYESVPEVVREETNLLTSASLSGTTTFSEETQCESEELEDLSAYPEHLRPYINGVKPMPPTYRNGKAVLPTEHKVAHYILEYYGDTLCRFEKSDLFMFDKTHWHPVTEGEKADIRNQIRVAYYGLASNSKIKATYESLFDLCMPMENNPYAPDPSKISFSNCTLHVVEDHKTRTWSIKTSPHNSRDFITHFIPYNIDESAVNPHFQEMLDNIFRNDPDKESKLLLIQEMYGACIAPIFPHLFLLHGPGGSGKTSLINCAMRLVHDDAKASVEPKDMEGFDMESCAGRLVNFVTDIDTNTPMADATIKRIEDRIPIRIKRKYKADLMAPLPAVHVFGGNGIPPTKDQTTNAMMRRWSFIHTYMMDKSENPTFDHANWVFDQCPEGVLAWALTGLKRLLKNKGRFTQFEAERKSVREWQSGRDSVQQFLEDIKSRDPSVGDLRIDETKSVFRSRVWENYVAWCDKVLCSKPRMGRNTFLKALEGKGHPTKATKNGFRMMGIYSESEKDA